jgi:hypothetical protein
MMDIPTPIGYQRYANREYSKNEINFSSPNAKYIYTLDPLHLVKMRRTGKKIKDRDILEELIYRIKKIDNMCYIKPCINNEFGVPKMYRQTRRSNKPECREQVHDHFTPPTKVYKIRAKITKRENIEPLFGNGR